MNYGQPASNEMEAHVTIVAWLHVVLGVISLLMAMFAGVLFGIFGAFLGAAAAGHSDSASPIGGILGFGGAGMIGFILVAVFAVPHFIVAWGLLNRQGWARIFGIVISILSLLHPAVAIGTAIAIYSLIILVQEQTVRLFQRAP